MKQSINQLKLYFFILSGLLISINSFATNPIQNLDSVYQYAKIHPTDTSAIKLLNNGCNQLYYEFSDTVRYYSEQQVYIARKGKLAHYEGRGYNMWGICMEFSGDLDSAIVLYEKALSIGLENADERLLIDVYNNLGIVYSYKGLYELSIENTVKALDLAEKNQDTSRIVMLYNNLGLRYTELRNNTRALFYLKKALELNESRLDTIDLISNYLNLGNIFMVKKEFEKALNYTKASSRFAKAASRKRSLIQAYNSIALTYLQMHELEISGTYNDSARAVAMEINFEYGIEQAKLVDGYIYQEKEQYDLAIPILENALKYNNSINFKSASIDILANLAECYHKKGENGLAYKRLKEFATSKDSLLTEQKDRAMEQVAIYKQAKQDKEQELLNQRIALQEKSLIQGKKLRNLFIVIGVLLLILAIGLTNRYLFEKRTKKILAEKNTVIEREKARSDELLLNILPKEVAEELKDTGASKAQDFDEVTVLFTDFVEFTKTTQKFTAKELVKELNVCFKAFDEIITRYDLEKIKTIGDAYMAASGLNKPRKAGAVEATLAAIDMQAFMVQRKKERQSNNLAFFEMRCGLNTGPVVAGIVGVKKFQFDIWGDTVNTASRMESTCEVGKVNVSITTYESIKNHTDLSFTERGNIGVKGKGKLKMWYVDRNII